MADFDRVIIGAGTSAAVYLCYYPARKRERVAVIGEPEPWARRGGHRMGQPPQLLELPMDPTEHSFFNRNVSHTSQKFGSPIVPMKAPRRVERLIKHYESIDKKSSSKPEGPFLESSRYAETVREILGEYNPIRKRVTQVSGGDPYTIVLDGDEGASLTADKVIIASGPGSARISKAYNEAYNEDPGIFASGESFLDEDVAVRKGGIVCVEGGSATAAWAVEKALSDGAKGVFWFTRTGVEPNVLDERFAAAFPAGGRNDWLKKNGDKIVWGIGDVVSSAPKSGKRIEVKFKNGLALVCDQYVAALGAAGGLNYVETNLRSTLKAVVDTNGHLDPNKKAIVGLANDDASLLAVGPVIYETNKAYSDSNKYLPTAGRPPEGIPTIIATIGALRRYLKNYLGGGQNKWVDFNLQSFTDLDEYFYNTVGFFLAAGLGTDNVAIEGYTLEQIARFVTDQVVGTRIMTSSAFGVTEDEVTRVFDKIWDFAYKGLGKKRQAEWKIMLDAYYDDVNKK